jgi:hypothetical protein
MLRISRSENFRRSLPWKRIEPAIFAGGSGTSRKIDMAVTDFPSPHDPSQTGKKLTGICHPPRSITEVIARDLCLTVTG